MQDGDPKARGGYDVPRTRVAVPLSLKEQIFSFINEPLRVMLEDPYTYPKPFSTKNFLETLDWFREIILQVRVGRSLHACLLL